MNRRGSAVDPQSGLPSPSPRDPLFSTDSHMDVQGFKRVRWRVWLCCLLSLLSLGLLLIIFHWRPRLGVLVRCRPCPLALADVLLLRDSFGEQHVVEVQTEEIEEGSLDSLGQPEEAEWRDNVQLHKEEKTLLRYYLFEGLRYVWLDRKGAFCRVSVLNEDWTCKDLNGFQKGLSPREQSLRRSTFGANLIDVPVKSYMRLLFEEVLNPFYVFQVFSITLWTIDSYYFYALCIFIISIISISISLYETRKQSVTLRNMARFITSITLRRDSGEEESVSSVELVPGDCLMIPQEGLLMPCDAALLAGECLVNESMLTGESVPVLKTPLPADDRKYNSEAERRHTLFCGTSIIQAKGGRTGSNGAVAVVTSTGFFTAKGDLVSSILYPQPINFRFYKDAMKFLLILGVVALIGTIYIFVILFKANVTWLQLVVRSLDIVTIVVPPALPAAITAGTIYAQRRLKHRGIFCISPPRINVCGKVSVFCFDKTGTLTEDGLDVWGVMEKGPAGFSELVPDPKLLPPGHMLSALACCHTVTLLQGQQLGDPLELKMVESTGWTLQEPEGDRDVVDTEFGKHKVLAVMRPPTQQPLFPGVRTSEPVAIVKRFPFSSALQRMSVVTVAHRGRSALAFVKGSPEMVASLCLADTVPAQFSSTLRNFSTQGLRVLALACKPVDVNSDLINTDRGEVEKDLQFLGLLMMKNLVKPESAKVINILKLAQIRNIMVTGDNILTAVNVAKSCAMVGSDEKVIFVNVTPHTTQSMPTLRFSLEDGAAQTSTDAVNQVKTTLADFQFLFCDLFLVTTLALFMGKGGPSEDMYPCRPPASLLSLPVFGSLFLYTCLISLGQLASFFITTTQDWFIPLNSTVFGIENLPNMENTCVFNLSGYQYIFMAVVVTKSYPHKKPLYHNVIFLCFLLVHSAVMTCLVLYPGPFFSQLFKLFSFTDMNFKMLLVAVAALNFLVCFVVEMLIDLGMLSFLRLLRGNRPSKKQYKRLNTLLSDSTSWLPLNQTLTPTDHSVIYCS
nr:cation-transporting ATPase 13A2 isoform X3 [Nothobranchius furzeri]